MINFINQGHGQPIILIHGLAASLYDWNDLIPDLVNKSYSVYALDLPGHGDSEKPDNLEKYTVNNLFQIFCKWIDSLELSEPLILIGHSLGGYLALQYAARYPKRIKSLILCDPFFSLNQLPFLLRINYKGQLINTTVIKFTPKWVFRRLIDFTSLSIRNGYVLPKNIREQTAADYKRAHPGIFNLVHTVQDFTPHFASICQPTLIIWGEHDQTLDPNSFNIILHEIPNSCGNAIKDAGHVPHQSHPKIFNKLVMDFLYKFDHDVAF